MAFGKAIGAEPLNLLEAAFGEVLFIAALDHPADHFLPKILDGPDIAERRHGAAKLIGLVGRELGRDNGQFHRLFLKQRHAVRVLQDIP